MLPEQTLQLRKDVQFKDLGFSAAETMGGFINNNGFSRGFLEWQDGEENSKTYLWETLSAIGDDLGQAIYGNVVNYVDKVSNVETCKIQALDSMMKEMGFEYGVFDAVGKFPSQIVDMMDVFSVDRKYVVGGNLLKYDLFLRYLRSGAVTRISSQDQVSSYVAETFLSSVSSDYTFDHRVLNQDAYDLFRQNVFQ